MGRGRGWGGGWGITQMRGATVLCSINQSQCQSPREDHSSQRAWCAQQSIVQMVVIGVRASFTFVPGGLKDSHSHLPPTAQSLLEQRDS